MDPPLSKVETAHEINLGPALSPYCVCFCVEEGAPLLRLMPLSLLNHSALALFAQRTRIPTSARSIGFCANWDCISSSSSSTGVPTLSSISFRASLLGGRLTNTQDPATSAYRKLWLYSDRTLRANGVTQLLGGGRLFFWIAPGILQ